MKYFLTLWIVLLTSVGTTFAEESPWTNKPNSIKPATYTECHAGFLFIIAASQNGVAIMQIFKDAGDMVPKPVECAEENKE